AQPDRMVAAGPEVSLQAVVGASSHTPVVLLAVNFDPVARGYVASLAQPGGNITGVVVRPIELAQKQIDLLKQTFPDHDRVAMLYDAQTADQFTAADQPARSAMILSSPGFQPHGKQIAELAIKHRLPTMFTFRHYVDVGGLAG